MEKNKWIGRNIDITPKQYGFAMFKDPIEYGQHKNNAWKRLDNGEIEDLTH